MKSFVKSSVSTALPWAFFFVLLDFFFVFLVWLSNPDTLHTLIPVIVLSSLILFTGLLFFLHSRQKKRNRAMHDFLEDPAPETLQQVLLTQEPALAPVTRELLETVLSQNAALENHQADWQQYREFIEEWTHNIKTPLSLATLILDNHKDEMSSYVYQRMTHVRQEIQTDVDMILYDARLQDAHIEYRFESIPLPEFLDEVLFNYREQMEETGIFVETACTAQNVVSDRKILTFLLSQLLNNAFQYTSCVEGRISICAWETDRTVHLAVRDNGCGVPTQDLPFLFDRGFTGNHPGRQHATGMGLYLTAKYAAALAIEIALEEETEKGEGFAIRLSFPKV